MAYDRSRFRLSHCIFLFTAIFTATSYAHAEAYDGTPEATDYEQAHVARVVSGLASDFVVYISNHEQDVAIIETDPGAAAAQLRGQAALFIDTSASGGLRHRMDRAARWRGHKRE